MPQPDYEDDLVFEPSDYDELRRLKEENYNLKHWSKSQCADEPYCEEVKKLRGLLKECKKVIKLYSGGYFEDSEHFVIPEENNDYSANEAFELLTRINAAIGEEE